MIYILVVVEYNNYYKGCFLILFMIDLRDAINVRNISKERGKEYKIGLVVEDFSGFVVGYKEGRVVVYREEKGLMGKDLGTLTVEIPCSRESVEQMRKEGNLLVTHSTCMHISKKYIEEIVLE